MKKKWFIVILILVAIAVVLTVVFINLFREKNTDELAKNVYNVTENGYLNDENEKNIAIKKYLQNILPLSELSDAEKTEVKNYYDSFVAFEIYGKFFERQIVFTKYTNVYKDNRKKISNAFNKAQGVVNNMYNYIQAHEDAVNDFWLATTWADCDSFMKEIFDNTKYAISRLAEVYQTSVTSPLMKNDFTKVVFKTTDELLDEVSKEIKTSKTASENLLKLANSYLTVQGEKNILNFNYNSVMKSNVASILKDGKNAPEYVKLFNGTIAA